MMRTIEICNSKTCKRLGCSPEAGCRGHVMRERAPAYYSERAQALVEDASRWGIKLTFSEGSEDARDAARYRWLRENKAYVAVQPHHKELPIDQRTGWTIRLITGNDANFDSAIDSAMAAKGE